MKTTNYTIIRVPKIFHQQMKADLQRPHPYAAERVGFFSTSWVVKSPALKIITVTGYLPLSDSDYIKDDSVGAKISSSAIRQVMERVISGGNGYLHVHLHDHYGTPTASITDKKSLPDVAKSLLNADPTTACGYFIGSKNSFFCNIYEHGQNRPTEVDQMTVIGYPTKFIFPRGSSTGIINKTVSRQSFLGSNSNFLFERVRIGIVGLGGGGSHIVQQLAHLGIKNFFLFDYDEIEFSNMNRLVGGEYLDVRNKLKKTKIAYRLIKRINPSASVKLFNSKWQDHSSNLKSCDIVIGGVDSIEERYQLESACRRSLIPLIDVGMDVHSLAEENYAMSGQIILSMPGMPCMNCFDFINEEKLTQEAKRYGAVGGRPQVIWPNGILASTAVGLVVDLITGWSKLEDRRIYLGYDGVLGHMMDHPKGIYCEDICSHYLLDKTGDPICTAL